MLDYVTIRRCTLTVACALAVQAGVAMAAAPAGRAVTPTATPPHAASPAPSAAGAAAPTAAELHALGVLLSQQLKTFEFSASEFRSVAQGFADGFEHPGGSGAVAQARGYVPQLQALDEQREERAGERYVRKAAALPHARRTASGMVYLALAQGSGATPRLGDQVTVQYTGMLTDGSVFDSSSQHGGTSTFTLGRVIPCWNEGLQLMKVGGKARLVCPSGLAYGTRGAGGVIPPGATLDFQVQLLAVKAGPAPGAIPPPGGAPSLSRPAAPH